MKKSLLKFFQISIALSIALGLTAWALLNGEKEEILFESKSLTWFETQNHVQLLLKRQAEIGIKSGSNADAFEWLKLHFGELNPHNNDGLSYHFPSNHPESTITILRGDLLDSSIKESTYKKMFLLPSEDGQNVLVRGVFAGDTVFRSTLPLPK